MSLSIVIPIRNEAPNLRPLLEEIAAAFAGERPEVIFVDDGSSDGGFELLRGLQGEFALDLKALKLAHHGGKSLAYAVGIREATRDLIGTMDGDLQDDPKDLVRLRKELLDQQKDAVIGWKRTGKSSPSTFVLSRAFNAGLRFLSGLGLHDMNCPLRVMRHEAAKSLVLHRDYHRYIPMLLAAKGYTLAELPVDNRPRRHGRSNYGSRKYFSSALALIGMKLHLSFGHRPMALFGGLGLLAFAFGGLICGWVALDFLVFHTDIDDDLPTLILGVLLLLIGTQFLSLGLFAEIVQRKLEALSGQDEVAIAESL